jgi:hypothetical protein
MPVQEELGADELEPGTPTVETAVAAASPPRVSSTAPQIQVIHHRATQPGFVPSAQPIEQGRGFHGRPLPAPLPPPGQRHFPQPPAHAPYEGGSAWPQPPRKRGPTGMPLAAHLFLGFALGVAIVAGYWAYQRFVVSPPVMRPGSTPVTEPASAR